MSLFSSGHKIIDFAVVPPNGGTPVDMRLQTGLISYYEDVTDSSLHITVDIQDTAGFLALVPIRSGSEVILRIEHPSGEIDFLNEPLYISNIVGNNSSSKREFYTLELVTKGAISNHTHRIYKKYKGKISDSVRKILTEDLDISTDRIKEVEDTSNEYSFMGNYKRPLFSCTWLCPKSIPQVNNQKNTGTAGYLFYETLEGYHFRSIDSVFQRSNRENVFEYFFSESADALDVKNNFRISTPPVWNTNNDILDKLRRGTYKAQTLYINAITKAPEFNEYNLKGSINNQMQLANDDEVIPTEFEKLPSRIMLSVQDQGTMSEKGDLKTPQDQNLYQAQGHARYSTLFSQTLNITVPMNLKLNCGDMIYCRFPKLNMEAADYGDNPNSGYYMIKSLAHKFSADGDFTGLQLVRDSYTELS